MCAYGLKDPVSGLPMKKPMSFLHNLAMGFFGDMVKRCSNDHVHQQIIGSTPGFGSRAVLSQVYPWTFCQKLAQVFRQTQRHHTNPTYHPCAAVQDLGQWQDVWEELADVGIPDNSPFWDSPALVAENDSEGMIPRMPCTEVPCVETHQDKTVVHPFLHHAMVARPVNRDESTTEPKAVAAMKAEWSTMHKKVWNCWEVREKSDVMREARRRGVVVQFGRVHGICVEKNSELPKDHPNRKYKGRVVFLGNRVANQDFEAATFADLGNAPAN